MKALTYLISFWSTLDAVAMLCAMYKHEWVLFLGAAFVQGLLTALAFKVYK